MKRAVSLLFILFTAVSISHPVVTRYLSDFKFDNIELYSFSNVSFMENRGIEISGGYKEIFSAQYPVWSMTVWKGGLAAGAGDPARVLFLNDEGSKVVYESSNDVLISDIQEINGSLHALSFPKAKILVLDPDFKVRKRITLGNEYAWSIIPDIKGYYVLAGSPAELYHFNEKDEQDFTADVKGEDNLLRGVIAGGDLYFSADGNVLYRFEAASKKVKAVFSFDNSIMDIIYRERRIYLITSVSETKKTGFSQTGESSSADDDSTSPVRDTPEKKSSKTMSGKSALFSYDPKGSIEKIFEKPGIRFIALSYMNDSIIVGTDKNAGYYQISLQGNLKRFSGFGRGKFARFFNLKGENYALLLEPARIIRMSGNYSAAGSVLSGVFDTGNISRWGKPFILSTIYPGTGLKIFTRSGALAQEDLWDDWVPYDNKINSSPNRFFQYKIELSAGGGKSPEFTSMVIPYVQKNSAPRIEKLAFNYNNNTYRISWDAVDDDKDILIYNLYLALDGGAWVKINDKPVEDSSFDLNTANFPEGQYRIKITASDERSNPPEEAREGYRISEPFVIDNSPPAITDIAVKNMQGTADLSFKVSDSLSPLLEVDYSVNGMKWIKIIPDSGIYDSPAGTFSLKLKAENPSFVMIKAVDLYGNYSTKGVYIGK